MRNSGQYVILACSLIMVAAVTWGIINPGIFGYPYVAGPALLGLSDEGIFFGIVFASATISIVAFIWTKQLNIAALLSPTGGSQVLASLSSILIVFVLAVIFYTAGNGFATAVLVGAFGGIVHEIAQSSGKFFLPGVGDGYLYLGGLFGLLEGGVAGLILATNLLNPASSTLAPTTVLISISFLAGVGIKGFSEAVAGQKVIQGTT